MALPIFLCSFFCLEKLCWLRRSCMTNLGMIFSFILYQKDFLVHIARQIWSSNIVKSCRYKKYISGPAESKFIDAFCPTFFLTSSLLGLCCQPFNENILILWMPQWTLVPFVFWLNHQLYIKSKGLNIPDISICRVMISRH